MTAADRPAPVLLAWEVYPESGEQGCFVFAKDRPGAVAAGAAELGLPAEAVESVLRMPEFDAYAPGPIPLAALLEQGCEYECPVCGRRIAQGARDGNGRVLAPVEAGDQVYCSASHAEQALSD